MRDVDDDDQSPKSVALRKLMKLGLNGGEIGVLGMVIEGYSTRRIAIILGRSQTLVRKLRRTAEQKLRRSGIAFVVPRGKSGGEAKLRMRTIDPLKLETMAAE